MELLVVTLAYTTSGRDADVLARVRLVTDTIRNAPGLVNSRFYRSRGNNSYYLMLTTWEDEESWHRARERHNPKHLLLELASEMLTASPEQWLMNYLWGYSRPSATPVVAAAHLASIRPDRVEFAQRGWIEGLRRPPVQTTLAFAFLARGMNERSAAESASAPQDAMESNAAYYQQGNMLLNLFNWGSEIEREDFYTDPSYQTISKFVNSVGVVRILPLEPM
jgi:quinol monooxygenase YgiN